MENYPVKRALIAVTIEKVLHEFGKSEYKEVESRLESEYGIYFTDCLEKPEYLKRVLQDIYGNAFLQIIAKINETLGELSEQKDYCEFLRVMKV